MWKVLSRPFTTKGHKRTRKIRQRELLFRKSIPPKLPQAPVSEEFKGFFSDRDNLVRLQEYVDYVYKEIMQEESKTLISERIYQIKSEVREQQKFDFKNARYQEALSIFQLDSLKLPSGLDANQEKMNEKEKEVLEKELVPASTNKPYENAIVLNERLDNKIESWIESEWEKELQKGRMESSMEVQKEVDKNKSSLWAHLGVRLIKAYERENDFVAAWKAFLQFNSHEGIDDPELIAKGIDVLRKKRNPQRAVQIFEIAEKSLNPQHLPLLYHPIMHACAKSRKACAFTFNLYNRMTKVEHFIPDNETLSIALQGCSTLGDVERAKLYWTEMVLSGDVVPNERSCTEMLNTIAKGNKMLRAKTLKAKNIKLVTFQDKELLASVGGFRKPPQEEIDEAGDVIRELDGDYVPLTKKEKYEARMNDLQKSSNNGVSLKRTPLTDFENEDDDDDEEEYDDDEYDDDDDDENDEGTVDHHDDNSSEENIDQIGEGNVTTLPGFVPTPLPTQVSNEATIQNIVSKSTKSGVFMKDLIPIDENQLVEDPSLSTPGKRQEFNMKYASWFLETVERRYDVKVDAAMLNAYTKVFAESLRIRRAVECLDLFREKRIKPDLFTYNTLIKMFARAQRLKETMEYFELAKNDKHLVISRDTVGPVIDLLARKGDLERACDLLTEYKDLKIYEKYKRVLRIKMKHENHPRLSEVGDDPNLWRSRETLARSAIKINKSKKLRKWQEHFDAITRSLG